ncbi:MAG: LCP family protein [Syntrophothermus sp.]|uniref:LCP family protein n=1 Tax=Syntrophothermus sp. TaxID=2736299 RepID=UPI00257D9529|nr:LCP family protein [Syntrophothermus sp.]NSW82986.1 LCP family protein [Syntrophothermus sp.]
MTKASALLKIGILLTACFLFSFGIGWSIPALISGELWSKLVETAKVAVGGNGLKDQMDILILGIDARKGETMTRSDTIMLARIDTKNGRVAVVSIPRDTRIEVPGSPVPKVNAACAVGGPKLACKVVGDLMDTKIDYYVLTNFNGFKDIVDTLGGVTIDVERRMYKPSEDIDLKPGVQRLNGRQALAYVRYRGYATGDIGRTEHQQKFMMALAQEMFQTKTILKLPKLVPQIAKNVQTNLSLRQMIALAEIAKDFRPENLHAQTLPGYFYTHAGISYWMADKKIAATILDDLLAGKTVAVLQDSPYPEESKTTTTTKTANKDWAAWAQAPSDHSYPASSDSGSGTEPIGQGDE